MEVQCAFANGTPIRINEIMASNNKTLRDPQGQFDDWIELHNFGNTPIDVAGMYLTDDLSLPTKWQIPHDNSLTTTIPPGGFLVVWADKDVTDGILHAAFALDADGEEIAIFGTDGLSIVDGVVFSEQTSDVSYGRFPDAGEDWWFMVLPTPGKPNSAPYEGTVANPKFSHDHGFYDTPLEVMITCSTPEAMIYYTLDGSEPYLTGGRWLTGQLYVGPIRITETTCLRVKAVKSGWLPSSVGTQTYIFLDDVINQPANPLDFPVKWGAATADYEMDPEVINDPLYRTKIMDSLLSIPSMSLVMATDDLFSASTGIYSNPTNQGTAWERPGSIELIYPDGTTGFQVNCGIRIQGGWFRSHSACRKHSFRLLFKAMYGSTKLCYPLFSEDATQEFDTITLRAGANDGYTWDAAYKTEQYIRDEFGRILHIATGNASPHGMFVHLYVNGLYWGLYNPCERPDASFSATYYGGDKENWDSIHDLSVSSGDLTAWGQMISMCQACSSSNEAYQRLQGNRPDGTPDPECPDLLDISNYIDYLIVNLWGGNWDWPWKNWWAARERSSGSTGFKFFCWDYENTMGNNRDRSPLNKNALYNNFTSAGQPHQYLKNNTEYRMLFADHVHRLFFNDGPLTPVSLVTLYSDIAATIEKAIIAESARWGDQHHHPPLTQQEWYNERDWILNTYLPVRTDIVLQQFRSAGLYPYVDAPMFSINESYRHGGHIKITEQLQMTSTSGTVWFTLDGSDPRMAVPVKRSDHSSDGNLVIVAENAPKRVLIPTGPIDDAWKTDPDYDDTVWQRGIGGIGYEWSIGYEQFFNIDVQDRMYGQQTTCYIRIPFMLDRNPDELDTIRLRIRYDDGFIAYLNGIEIARRNFAGEPTWNSSANTQNSDADAINWEDIPLVVERDNLRHGENILAVHGLNELPMSSDFLISVMLTTGAFGSLQGSEISPTAVQYTGPVNLTESTQIRARVLSGDTWSALNEAVFAVGPIVESLRISEIMYHPTDTGNPNDPNTEYIELTNIGVETINLNLTSFTKGINFTFSSFELAPGGYCLVVKDLIAFEDKYDVGLNVAGQYHGSLSNAGERIQLQDAAGAIIHSFCFKDNWFDITDGRGFSLTVIAPSITDPASLDSKSAWRPSTRTGGSPGFDDSSDTMDQDAMSINELLYSSEKRILDWIELYNVTD